MISNQFQINKFFLDYFIKKPSYPDIGEIYQ